MVRKKSPEQIEKEKAERLKSTVMDPIEAFAKGANPEFSTQHDNNISVTLSQHDADIHDTESKHDNNVNTTMKLSPKETHLHVVMHPDIKAALRKLAKLDRRKVAETARELIVNGLRQRGIDL